MNFHNYEKARFYEVEKWIIDKFELTDYQKSKLRNDEVVRWSPFEFYKERPRVNNVLMRFTIILMPIVWILLFIGLPLTFLIKGRWGYGGSIMNFYDKWKNNIGL